MRTEYSKRDVVSIFLVLALVFSMVTISAPLASPGDWVNRPAPGGTTIDVIAGENFLIRYVLEWDEPEDGAYTITLGWYNYGNKPEENLTFVSAEAYFTTGANVGESIRADATLSSAPSGADTAWALEVSCPATNKDNRNGEFNVDITLGAYGVGGVPHISGNHVIPWMLGGVIVTEAYPLSWIRNPITIRVLAGGVDVLISPGYQSGLPGSVLNYTVTVKNTGEYDDNYDLTASDNAGWGPTVSPTLLTVPVGENRTATLSVTVPGGAAGCTEDNMTVMATGTAVENSASAIAHVTVVRAAKVSISPGYQTGFPGDNLNYIVTVKNTGNVTDNYILIASDDAGWSPAISPSSLVIPAGENDNATLSVTVPINAIGSTNDNITVTATSTENVAVSAENTSVAHATVVRGVDVSISPTYGSAQPESDITYTVTVANVGNAQDTYDLTASDNAGWSLNVTPSSLTVPPFENRNATLRVTVPSNTPYSTLDNITVTATSRENTAVSDNASCIGHAAMLRRVKVAISPVRNSALPGGTLSYTVTVTNTGNIWDNYSLAVSDTAGWSPSVSPSTIALAMGQSDNATLSVTVPDVAPCTEDNVQVTATSQADNTVSDNTSCIAHRVKPGFSLLTLYKVNLGLDFYLHTGTRIVVKFYTWGGTPQGENVVWSGTTPTQVIIFENIPHPQGTAVEKAELVLTDAEGATISTLSILVVRKVDLEVRFTEIPLEWFLAQPADRITLELEFSAIPGKWFLAPS